MKTIIVLGIIITGLILFLLKKKSKYIFKGLGFLFKGKKYKNRICVRCGIDGVNILKKGKPRCITVINNKLRDYKSHSLIKK